MAAPTSRSWPGMWRDHGVPAAVYRDGSGVSRRPPGRAAGRCRDPGAGPSPSSGSPRSPPPRPRRRVGSSACGDLPGSARVRAPAGRRPPTSSAQRVLSGSSAGFNTPVRGPGRQRDRPAWRPAPRARDLARICAFRWWRVVGNDNTVRVEAPSSSCHRARRTRRGRAARRGRAPARRPAPRRRPRPDLLAWRCRQASRAAPVSTHVAASWPAASDRAEPNGPATRRGPTIPGTNRTKAPKRVPTDKITEQVT